MCLPHCTQPHPNHPSRGCHPDFHLLSFDNFGVAFLTIFRIFTGDLWFKPLQFVIDGWSGWGATFILSFLFLAVAFFHNFVLVVRFELLWWVCLLGLTCVVVVCGSGPMARLKKLLF